jgi:hypothetical protein
MLYRRVRAFAGRGWICQRTRVVVANESNYCDAPIFIVGTHRSGTSLLRRVLDSHRHIACPPESFWLRHFTPLLNDSMSFDGLWNLGFERHEALAGLRRAASYFHEAYRRAKAKPRWADKTPQYVDHLDTLRLLFGARARFVMIVRHPLDVAYSIWNRGWSFDQPSAGPVRDACEYVLRCGRRQLQFLKLHPEQTTLIHYQQLMASPESTLRSLCEFLDEPWDSNMLRHHEMPHDFGCEDPVARGTAGFRGSFDNWRAWPDESIERACAILMPLMHELGYSTGFVASRERKWRTARCWNT